MVRYVRVFVRQARGSLMAALEYRIGFAAALSMSLIDAFWAIGGAWVLYSHRPTVGGWHFHETLIVIGLFFVASGLLDAFLQPSLRELMESIRVGKVDYWLIRPLDSMVYATMQRQRFEKLSSFWIGAGLVILGGFTIKPSPVQVLLFTVLLGMAAVLLYAFMSLLMAATFWAVEITNIEELLFGILETARYPVHAFPEPLRTLLSWVVPIAFVSTVPAEALLGRLDWLLVLHGAIVILLLLSLSRLFWREALRHYSGAGG